LNRDGSLVLYRRRFSRAFKLKALKRLERGDKLGDVARLCKIDPNLLRRWERDYESRPESAFPGSGRRPKERGIEELQREIERHAQEIDHLKQRILSRETKKDECHG